MRLTCRMSIGWISYSDPPRGICSISIFGGLVRWGFAAISFLINSTSCVVATFPWYLTGKSMGEIWHNSDWNARKNDHLFRKNLSRSNVFPHGWYPGISWISVPDQQLKLMGSQSAYPLITPILPPLKPPFRQPLLAQPEPLTVIHQYLYGCFPLVSKYKNIAWKGI